MDRKNKVLEILIYICFFILIVSVILPRPISDMDELWNYNFARNVASGLLPYKDFNMVQMPLLPFICAIFLKVIGDELIVMRILASILCTAIMFLIYKIFTLLKIDKRVCFLLTSWIIFFSRDIFCIDYNWSTLLIVLAIVYIELRNLEKNNYEQLVSNFKTDLIIGILAGLTVCLKQTTGLAICIVSVGYKLLLVKDKESLKKYIKILGYRILGVLLIIISLIIYLIASNSFKDWFEYTILGIKYFDNAIEYYNLFNNKAYILRVLAVLIPVNFIYLYIKTIFLKQKYQTDKELFVLFVYGLSMFILVYPIADKIHFTIAGMISIISVLYMIYNILSKLKLDKKSFVVKEFAIYMVLLLVILASVIYSINNFLNYIQTESKSQEKHYKYISINENLEKEIDEVDRFILEQESKGKKTIILDAYACIYMIPIDKYNKDFDMLLKGNLGNNETEKLINNLESQSNINILVRNNGNLNWQTPVNIIEYVKKSKTKAGSIVVFDIYN